MVSCEYFPKTVASSCMKTMRSEVSHVYTYRGVYVCSKTGTVKNPYALTLHGLDYFISHMKQRLEDTNKTVDDMHGIEWKDPQNSQTKAGQHTHELQVPNQLPTSTAMPRTGAAVAEAALPQTQSNMRTQQVPKSSRDAQPMEDVIDLTGDVRGNDQRKDSMHLD